MKKTGKSWIALLVAWCLLLSGVAHAQDTADYGMEFYQNATVSDWYGDTTDEERVAMAAELMSLMQSVYLYNLDGMEPGQLAQRMNDHFDEDENGESIFTMAQQAISDLQYAREKREALAALTRDDWEAATDDEKWDITVAIILAHHYSGFPVYDISSLDLIEDVNNYYAANADTDLLRAASAIFWEVYGIEASLVEEMGDPSAQVGGAGSEYRGEWVNEEAGRMLRITRAGITVQDDSSVSMVEYTVTADGLQGGDGSFYRLYDDGSLAEDSTPGYYYRVGEGAPAQEEEDEYVYTPLETFVYVEPITGTRVTLPSVLEAASTETMSTYGSVKVFADADDLFEMGNYANISVEEMGAGNLMDMLHKSIDYKFSQFNITYFADNFMTVYEFDGMTPFVDFSHEKVWHWFYLLEDGSCLHVRFSSTTPEGSQYASYIAVEYGAEEGQEDIGPMVAPTFSEEQYAWGEEYSGVWHAQSEDIWMFVNYDGMVAFFGPDLGLMQLCFFDIEESKLVYPGSNETYVLLEDGALQLSGFPNPLVRVAEEDRPTDVSMSSSEFYNRLIGRWENGTQVIWLFGDGTGSILENDVFTDIRYRLYGCSLYAYSEEGDYSLFLDMVGDDLQNWYDETDIFQQVEM